MTTEKPYLCVKFSDAICAIESYDDVEQVGLYIDRKTGQTFWVMSDLEIEPTEPGDDTLQSAEPLASFDEVASDSERYLQFPSTTAVDKVDRAETFTDTCVLDPKVKRKLLKLIKKARNRGWTDSPDIYALICKSGLVAEWNAYNDTLNEAFLRNWCEDHGIFLCE